MKSLISLATVMTLVCAAIPAHSATYAELNTEAQAAHRAAEKNQADAKALFDKGDKAAGCALMLTVVSQRKRTRDILTAVKASFDKGQGSKASRALFPDISMSIHLTNLNVESSATMAAENGC